MVTTNLCLTCESHNRKMTTDHILHPYPRRKHNPCDLCPNLEWPLKMTLSPDLGHEKFRVVFVMTILPRCSAITGLWVGSTGFQVVTSDLSTPPDRLPGQIFPPKLRSLGWRLNGSAKGQVTNCWPLIKSRSDCGRFPPDLSLTRAEEFWLRRHAYSVNRIARCGMHLQEDCRVSLSGAIQISESIILIKTDKKTNKQTKNSRKKKPY